MGKGRSVAMLVVIGHLAVPAVARATSATECSTGQREQHGPGLVESQAPGAVRIKTGVDAARVWLTADYGDLRVRKFTQRGGATVIDFRYQDDLVTLSLAPGNMTVTRGGVTERIGSQETVTRVAELVGGSKAMFAARAMLGHLEQTSALDPAETSLLSAVAFVATLSGDTSAPRRLGDRFMAKHFGRIRPIRFTCWSEYSGEVNSTWDDYVSCITEAGQGSVFFQYIREQACAATWVLRAESAWFEYLSCLSPLSAIKGDD